MYTHYLYCPIFPFFNPLCICKHIAKTMHILSRRYFLQFFLLKLNRIYEKKIIIIFVLENGQAQCCFCSLKEIFSFFLLQFITHEVIKLNQVKNYMDIFCYGCYYYYWSGFITAKTIFPDKMKLEQQYPYDCFFLSYLIFV